VGFECRKCYARYLGIGRLKERGRIYQKKLQRRFFGDELLKALDKQRTKNLENFLCSKRKTFPKAKKGKDLGQNKKCTGQDTG
jgi:hypothetical protein